MTPASAVWRSLAMRATVAALVVVVFAVGTRPVAAETAEPPLQADCAGWLGIAAPGSPRWMSSDTNNVECAQAGLALLTENPAVVAARAANAQAGDGAFVGDPFRAPSRWAVARGSYQQLTYQDHDGKSWPATLFGPKKLDDGPYPGVLLVCHACFPPPQTTQNVGLWYWAAESLAESGYIVFYAAVGGNDSTRTIDATDFFTATPTKPTMRGEFNPWWQQLDRSRLGIVGHSGAAGVALDVGNRDSRFAAIVAWDPAASADLTGTTPRTPTMLQVADYTLRAGPVPNPTRPIPAPGDKYTFYDAIRSASVDVMQIAPRASTHLDWTHFAGANPFGPSIDHGVYGEMVATYYTRAWLDRYVRAKASPVGPPRREQDRVTKAALSRLVANGRQRFDRSVDRSSIGSGFFNRRTAARAGSDEAGNVPIKLHSIPIRNLLSFLYPSRYSLERGHLRCDDVRSGCK
jgi:dienelactone hydrolase